MKTSIMSALTAPENRKAVTIGITAGAAVVIGACAIKVAGLGLAGKCIVGAALAAAGGAIVKHQLDKGALNRFVDSIKEWEQYESAEDFHENYSPEKHQ